MNRMQGRRFLMKMAAPLLALTLFLAQGGEAYAAAQIVSDVEARRALPIVSNETEGWPQGPVVSAQSAVVMEASTGAILYEKEAHDQLYPASITKIVTSLVVLEHCDNLQEDVTFSHAAVTDIEDGGHHWDYKEGEILTVEQCLYAFLLESVNECGYALAEHVAGSVSAFADMMNEKAAEVGCTNTHFNNTNGLPDEQHYTSTRDMLLIARAAYENEEFRKITGTKVYVIPPTNKHEDETTLHNHHNMLYPFRTAKYIYDGCTGGKTGYTVAANSTLVTYAERDGMSLVCVVMNAQAPAHFEDTVNLFNYCFDNFQIFSIKDNEKAYTKDKIQDTGILNTDQSFAGLDKNGGIILPKTASFEDAKVEVKEKGESKNSAGRLEYTYAGHAVGGADIMVTKAEPEKFPFDNTKEAGKKGEKTAYVKGNTIVMLVIIVLVCAALALIGRYVSDNSFVIKTKVDRKRNKPDPRYTIIRNSKKKWRRK